MADSPADLSVPATRRIVTLLLPLLDDGDMNLRQQVLWAFCEMSFDNAWAPVIPNKVGNGLPAMDPTFINHWKQWWAENGTTE
jgi:hypothetical protein